MVLRIIVTAVVTVVVAGGTGGNGKAGELMDLGKLMAKVIVTKVIVKMLRIPTAIEKFLPPP